MKILFVLTRLLLIVITIIWYRLCISRYIKSIILLRLPMFEPNIYLVQNILRFSRCFPNQNICVTLSENNPNMRLIGIL